MQFVLLLFFFLFFFKFVDSPKSVRINLKRKTKHKNKKINHVILTFIYESEKGRKFTNKMSSLNVKKKKKVFPKKFDYIIG